MNADDRILLLDFENLVRGATSSLPNRADTVPTKALTWLCGAYGPTTIRRAYADWADTRFGRYQQALERNGIDLGHGPARKNGADIRMAVDAMETLIIHPAVEAFVLVTGDSNFSPLVSKLREFGKHVIGVGAETAASARLVSVCSEYKLWGSIVARVDPPPETAQPSAQPGFRLADAEALLVAAMRQITAATPTASQIKAKMVLLNPSFDEANYGCGSFRDFLARLDHRVRTAGRSGGDITLVLVDAAANPGSKKRSGSEPMISEIHDQAVRAWWRPASMGTAITADNAGRPRVRRPRRRGSVLGFSQDWWTVSPAFGSGMIV